MNLAKLIEKKLSPKGQEAFLNTIRSAALQETLEAEELRDFLKKLGLWEESEGRIRADFSVPHSTSTARMDTQNKGPFDL